MRNDRRNAARAALLLLAAALVVGAPTLAAALVLPGLQCPTDITRVATVPETCPCNPARKAPFGACDSGFVCAQPWVAQVAAAATGARQLLDAAAAGGSDSTGAAASLTSSTSGFVCAACAYGQLCPRGSALPPVLSPSIQL